MGRFKEEHEDMMIALYLTGEGKEGFDPEHMAYFCKIMRVIREVRKKIKG